MNQAIPISSFLSFISTLIRFGINYKKNHPKKPERNAINYEVVQVTTPFVFLGSFFGVVLGMYLHYYY
jgi:hypothetical protein